MIAPDAHFKQRTLDSFAKQPAMATLGVTVESVDAGRVVLALAHRADRRGDSARTLAVPVEERGLQGRPGLRPLRG